MSSGGVSRHHCGAERMSERGGTQGGDGRVGETGGASPQDRAAPCDSVCALLYL